MTKSVLKSEGLRRAQAALVILVLAGLPRGLQAQVTISDDTDAGVACFKVVTPSATYFYDKAGAGFTSIVDKDGNDWIGYKAGGGASGEYRGIPNMGLNKFGHPGYTGATSTTNDAKGQSLAKVTVVSKKGGWHTSWEFFATHARMTVHAVEENYWFLYEGTPGGAVGSDDVCHRSSGETNNLDGSWEGDVVPSAGVPGVEWVFFADGTLDRSLFLAHDDDSKTDRYYLMSPMTVFGFGRHKANLNRLMDATPATLVVGLIESRSFATVEQAVATAFAATPPPPKDSGPPPPPKDAGAPPPPPPKDAAVTPPSDSAAPPPPTDSGGPPPPANDGATVDSSPSAVVDGSPSTDTSVTPGDGEGNAANADGSRLEGEGCGVAGSRHRWPAWILLLLLLPLAGGRRRR